MSTNRPVTNEPQTNKEPVVDNKKVEILEKELADKEIEINKLKKNAEEAAVKKTEEPKLTPGNIPSNLKDKNIKTLISKMSDKIKFTMEQMKDMATLELRLPVESRLRTRMQTIREEGRAQSIKVEGHWKTTAPKMHITPVVGRKLTNDEAQIKFSTFLTDEDGNKIINENSAVKVTKDGREYKEVISAEYVLGFDIVETIKFGKKIQREIIERDAHK